MSSGSGLLRNLPENLLIPASVQAIEAELSQPIFSWKVGLRPIRTRIEGLTTLGNAIDEELHATLKTGSSEWGSQAQNTLALTSDAAKLSVCVSNARMLVKSIQKSYLSLAFRILQLNRRRNRVTAALRYLERISDLKQAIEGLSKASVVGRYAQMRSILESLPAELSIVESTQARLGGVIRGYRFELMELLALVAADQSVRSFEEELVAQLAADFGSSSDSFVTNESVFWYRCSPSDEEALVSRFIVSLFEKNLIAQLVAGETWERLLTSSADCRCQSSQAFSTVVSRVDQLSTIVPVLDDELVGVIKSAIVEIYAALLLLTFGGSAFCAIVSQGVGSDLVNAHECWLTRMRLPRLQSLIDSDSIGPRLDELNKLRPRTGRAASIAQQVVAVESFRSLARDEGLYWDLADAVFTPILVSSFAHAFERWRSLLNKSNLENYAEANSYFLNETKAFFSMLKCTAGGSLPESGIRSMAALAGRVMVLDILDLIPSLVASEDASLVASEDGEEMGERTQFLLEVVSDLQSRLGRVGLVVIEKSEWSLLFECLQLIGNSELLLSWCVSNLLRVPLRVLAALLEVAEADEETRLDFLEILHDQAIAFITDS